MVHNIEKHELFGNTHILKYLKLVQHVKDRTLPKVDSSIHMVQSLTSSSLSSISVFYYTLIEFKRDRKEQKLTPTENNHHIILLFDNFFPYCNSDCLSLLVHSV